MSAGHYDLGLIGFPLGHSLSPRLHAAALEALHLTGEYCLYPVPPLPEGRAALEVLLERLRVGELQGLNVTIPHKQTVLGYLDELLPSARAVGAANTLLSRDGRLVGENTDAAGFSRDLERSLGLKLRERAGTALVLGAGGAARAAVFALVDAGWEVMLAARRLEQGLTLARSFNSGDDQNHGAGAVRPYSLEELPAVLAGMKEPPGLIVNATPVGMAPNSAGSPWPAGLPLPSGAAVYDLVYNPPQTALVRAAQRAGLPAAGGLGMLVEQAALAFELWTGQRPPREPMWAAVWEFANE